MNVPYEDKLKAAFNGKYIPLVEYNHCNVGFDSLYIILWGRDGHVRHWLYDGHAANNQTKPLVIGNLLMWKEKGKQRVIRFGELKHTYTKYDKEMKERQRRPLDKRKKLFR